MPAGARLDVRHDTYQAHFLPPDDVVGNVLCIQPKTKLYLGCTADALKPLQRWLHMDMQQMCAAVNSAEHGRNYTKMRAYQARVGGKQDRLCVDTA